MMKKRKGNILLITLITCMVMSTFALLALSVVSRYDRSIRSRFEDLQKEVYDDGSDSATTTTDTTLEIEQS